MSSFLPRAVLAFLVVSVLPAFAHAGYGGGGARGGGGSGSGSSAPAVQVPPVDHSGSIKARKDVAAASVEVNRAVAAVAAVLNGLHRELEQTTAWKELLAAQSAAQAQIEAARTPALAALRARPDYVAAKAARDKAVADRDAMATDPAATPQDRSRVALAVADSNLLVRKLETDTVAADPKFAVAQSSLLDVHKRMAEAVRKFDESHSQNPEVQAAAKIVEEKKVAMAAAQKQLSDAVASEAAAERERQKQIAQAHQ